MANNWMGTEKAIAQAKVMLNTLIECRATDATVNLRASLLEFLESYGVQHNAS
jgi:hypothetical protein